MHTTTSSPTPHLKDTNDYPLGNLHHSINVTQKGSFFKRLFSFLGPAYLVSIGYMDPGNWATDIAAGSRFGYQLLWVLLMSNIAAIFLQGLCVRLGIVYGRDLAQANRESYPRWLNLSLYVLAELAIVATDLAKVLGMAIGLYLLTDLPLRYGILITILDTFLLLYLQRLGIRKMEGFIIAMIAIILGAFLFQNILVAPNAKEMAQGFLPYFENQEALYIAIGIIGATIMPHNLYLHSALVQTRNIGKKKESIKNAIKFNFIDSIVALNLAFFVNAGILILAAGALHTRGFNNITEIKDAYVLLEPLLGSSLAPILFAIALIAAGQSSTITGTLAGQIVMEGYLQWRINPLVRRFISRCLAVIPAFFIVYFLDDSYTDKLLIFSQVILSLQLGFAIIPLVNFVSDKRKMHDFVLPLYQKIIAWLIIGVLLVLNIMMAQEELITLWHDHTSLWIRGGMLIGAGFLLFLLGYLIIFPLINRHPLNTPPTHIHPITIGNLKENLVLSQRPPYTTIAVCLDFSTSDTSVLREALAQASPHTRFVLIHIVESVTAKIFGNKSADYETLDDAQLLAQYAQILQEHGYTTTPILGFPRRIKEIPKIVRKEKAQLLVVGAHRHKAKNKIIFGYTIDSIRKYLSIPVLIVNT